MEERSPEHSCRNSSIESDSKLDSIVQVMARLRLRYDGHRSNCGSMVLLLLALYCAVMVVWYPEIVLYSQRRLGPVFQSRSSLVL